VVAGYVLERLRRIVVEVRRREPDAAQRRDLEGVQVRQLQIVDDPRDQRAAGIRAEDVRFVDLPLLNTNSGTW
jgi:hypothetical protein